jgi:hypothetical protein
MIVVTFLLERSVKCDVVCFRGWFLLLEMFLLRESGLLMKIPIVWDVKRCCVTYSEFYMFEDLSVAR